MALGMRSSRLQTTLPGRLARYGYRKILVVIPDLLAYTAPVAQAAFNAMLQWQRMHALGLLFCCAAFSCVLLDCMVEVVSFWAAVMHASIWHACVALVSSHACATSW